MAEDDENESGCRRPGCGGTAPPVGEHPKGFPVGNLRGVLPRSSFRASIICLNSVDALFAVAEMSSICGFYTARFLCENYSQILVYLLRQNDDFRRDAIPCGADGYIVKPVTPETLQKAQLAEDAMFFRRAEQSGNLSAAVMYTSP